jgi:hypothetical protein
VAGAAADSITNNVDNSGLNSFKPISHKTKIVASGVKINFLN